LKNLNQANEALKSFQRAAAYKKNYYQAYIQMGEILINYKQYKKAIAVYDKVFEFRKKDEHATIQSAKCHHLLKDIAKANKLIRSLSQRSQNTLEAVKLRCRIALSTNDITLAGQLLNMARNFNNNADLWVVRALYVLKQSRIEQAKQYLEQAKKLDPLNREAEELLKSLNAKPKKSAKKAQQKPKEQQSIMFQKAKPKKKNQFQISNQ
jgi:tetratricopeptide (TPR) repeat protein